MAIKESSYLNMLQGISQQIPRERLDGYVSDQLNMLSDPVTGLRRRPGFKFLGATANNTFASDFHKIRVFQMEEQNATYYVMINTSSGQIRVVKTAPDLGGVQEYNVNTDAYFVANDPSSLRAVSMRGELFVANVEKIPTYSPNNSGWNPKLTGFFYVKVGAFEKDYELTLGYEGNGYDRNGWTFRTPKVDDTADSAPAGETVYDPDAWGDSVQRASPDGIAAKFVQDFMANSEIRAKWTMIRDGSYIFIRRTGAIDPTRRVVITSKTGSVYVGTSNGMVVPQISDLPANVHQDAEGMICAVGTNRFNYTYYKWVKGDNLWRECGAYGSPGTFTDMPRSFIVVNGTINLKFPQFPGREAGDDNNNPIPAFVDGITGLTVYQGRLGILSRGFISFSASNEPNIFYRKTVASLQMDEPFDIGAGAAASTAWEYGIPFNKDLVVFSRTQQAVIPAASVAMSSQTANLQITSWQNVDTNCEPVVVGKTLMYPASTVGGFFSIGEMYPSENANSLYVPQTLTDHIPNLLVGRCRKMVNSSSLSKAVFLSNTDRKSLYIHEYFWAGTERAQNSWHRWTFHHEIVDVFFSGDKLVALFGVQSGGGSREVWFAYLDPSNLWDKAYTDAWQEKTVVVTGDDSMGYLATQHLVRNAPVEQSDILVVDSQTGEEVQLHGVYWNPTTDRVYLYFERAMVGKRVKIGIRFNSILEPTPPVVKDWKGSVISNANATLLKYKVHTRDSGEYEVDLYDSRRQMLDARETPAMTWGSFDLMLGQARRSDMHVSIVPVHIPCSAVRVQLKTDGASELNIVDLEYDLKVASRPTRGRI